MPTSNGGSTNGRKYTKIDWNDFSHTGPDTLAGRYLRMFWHPISRSQDLPAGEAKPVRIMAEDFTLYRGTAPSPLAGDGGDAPPPQSSPTAVGGAKPHLLAFRCAHKGTQLSVGWVEGENIRCYYHGWVYDPSGQCLEQPAEQRPFCEKIRIRSYPTQEYLGLVFAYLGEGEPPALPRYPDQ